MTPTNPQIGAITGATGPAGTALSGSITSSTTASPQTWTSNPYEHYHEVIAACSLKPSVQPCPYQHTGLELVLVPVVVGVAVCSRNWWPGPLGSPPPRDSTREDNDDGFD